MALPTGARTRKSRNPNDEARSSHSPLSSDTSARSQPRQHCLSRPPMLPPDIRHSVACLTTPDPRPVHARSRSEFAKSSRAPPAPLDLSQTKALMQSRHHSTAYTSIPPGISSRSIVDPSTLRRASASPGGSPDPANGMALPDPPFLRNGSHTNLSSSQRPRPKSVAQPLNLLGSVRPMSFSSRPLSGAFEPERIVTGVLQSALPVNSRPVQPPTKPSQSMSIHELDERHKFALRQLQSKTKMKFAEEEAKAKEAALLEKKAAVRAASAKKESSDAKGFQAAATPGKGDKSRRKSFFGFFAPKNNNIPPPPGSPEIINSRELASEDKAAEALVTRSYNSDEDVPLALLRKQKSSGSPPSIRKVRRGGQRRQSSQPMFHNHSHPGRPAYRSSQLLGIQEQAGDEPPSDLPEVLQEQSNVVLTTAASPYNSRLALPLPSYSNHSVQPLTHSMSHESILDNPKFRFGPPATALRQKGNRDIRQSKRFSVVMGAGENDHSQKRASWLQY